MSRDTIRRTAIGLDITERPGEHWWWYCGVVPPPNDYFRKACSKRSQLSDQEFCALRDWSPGMSVPCGWFYDETIV